MVFVRSPVRVLPPVELFIFILLLLLLLFQLIDSRHRHAFVRVIWYLASMHRGRIYIYILYYYSFAATDEERASRTMMFRRQAGDEFSRVNMYV
jgi:hypothetical protein